jgi:methylmalonyl-CoA mutase N-terminal domain/subunit
MKLNPENEKAQVARLKAWRSQRDASKHAAALQKIENAAKGTDGPGRSPTGDNLLPFILEGVKAGGTVGEIANVLRGVWGEHTETLVL